MTASSAFIGSISVTITLPPWPAAQAMPRLSPAVARDDDGLARDEDIVA